jgi:hypothetical protein
MDTSKREKLADKAVIRRDAISIVIEYGMQLHYYHGFNNDTATIGDLISFCSEYVSYAQPFYVFNGKARIGGPNFPINKLLKELQNTEHKYPKLTVENIENRPECNPMFLGNVLIQICKDDIPHNLYNITNNCTGVCPLNKLKLGRDHNKKGQENIYLNRDNRPHNLIQIQTGLGNYLVNMHSLVDLLYTESELGTQIELDGNPYTICKSACNDMFVTIKRIIEKNKSKQLIPYYTPIYINFTVYEKKESLSTKLKSKLKHKLGFMKPSKTK